MNVCVKKTQKDKKVKKKKIFLKTKYQLTHIQTRSQTCT